MIPTNPPAQLKHTSLFSSLLEAVSKEVGMKDVTLANVILVVGTNKATDSALTYRQKIVGSSNLNIIIIDGPLLQQIIRSDTTRGSSEAASGKCAKDEAQSSKH